jgi:hypothetical protein
MQRIPKHFPLGFCLVEDQLDQTYDASRNSATELKRQSQGEFLHRRMKGPLCNRAYFDEPE